MERLRSTTHEFTDAEEKLLVAEQLMNATGEFGSAVEAGEGTGLTTDSVEYKELQVDLIDLLFGMAAARENEANTEHLLPRSTKMLPLSELSVAVNMRLREWFNYGLMEGQRPALDEFLVWQLDMQQMMQASVPKNSPPWYNIERAKTVAEVRLGVTADDFNQS